MLAAQFKQANSEANFTQYVATCCPLYSCQNLVPKAGGCCGCPPETETPQLLQPQLQLQLHLAEGGGTGGASGQQL
jgi:hypothetical protein